MARFSYNPYSRTYAQGTPKRNSYTRQFESAAKNSSLQYNRQQKTYVLAPRGSVDKFNPYTRKTERARPGSKMVYNRYTRTYEYEK